MRGGPFLIQFLAAAAVAAAFVAPTGLAFVPTATIPQRLSSLLSHAGPRRPSPLWCELCGDDTTRPDDEHREKEQDVTSGNSLFTPAIEDDKAINPVSSPGAGEGKGPAALGGAMINFVKVRVMITNPT